MKAQKAYFAVDLGATSGRTIIGSITDGKVQLRELTRFENALIETSKHVYWDIYALYNEIIRALKIVKQEGIEIESIGIDTWGVDFVCVGKDGNLLSNPIAYRDPYTFEAMEQYFKDCLSRKEVYALTGIQFMNFNSIFQLYAQRKEQNSALLAADKILFMPDALGYLLTGNAVTEYTIASTSQILNPKTKRLDDRILASLGLTEANFGQMVMPGEEIGCLTKEVQRITGLGAVKVVAVAGHDTASAVAAVPAKTSKFAYLSSGTWSLMGIETLEPIINEQSYSLNFTNEGGIEGTTRFLKNICGMWIYERCRKEWQGAPASHKELQEEAMRQQAFRSLINPDDEMFANPKSMVKAIEDYCRKTNQPVPEDYRQMCRAIFDSLALRYRQVMGYLKEMAKEDIEVLHIIGGGSLNEYLDQFTANATGLPVLAGPQEGTALGNIMIQAKASGLVKDIMEMRSIISRSIPLKRFEPKDEALWQEAYTRFLAVTKA